MCVAAYCSLTVLLLSAGGFIALKSNSEAACRANEDNLHSDYNNSKKLSTEEFYCGKKLVLVEQLRIE